jgi:predicted O-linked N-acetylglucosamine transferase (SPINDLY family)
MIFLPITPSYSGYIQRLRECDVVLDTIHYCGGNTSLEAISAGALVVTLPSGLNRGRHTYGFLRKMRFTDTVATSVDDYVDRAVRIATSPELRMELKKKQEESCAALYEDDGAIRQMERFFEEALAASAAQSPL